MDKCLQCSCKETDNSITLFKTKNFRISLRGDDQSRPGRCLIIPIEYLHPNEFKRHIDLIIEENIISIIIYETFKKAYGYERGQLLTLGNLTHPTNLYMADLPYTHQRAGINYAVKGRRYGTFSIYWKKMISSQKSTRSPDNSLDKLLASVKKQMMITPEQIIDNAISRQDPNNKNEEIVPHHTSQQIHRTHNHDVVSFLNVKLSIEKVEPHPDKGNFFYV